MWKPLQKALPKSDRMQSWSIFKLQGDLIKAIP